MSRKRLKLGDIYEIPLPNGRKAFARLYKEFTLAVYEKTYEDMSQLSYENKYQFIVGVYEDLLRDGEWKIVGNRPFAAEDEAWPPAQCIRDKISGKYSIYVKGEMIPSTEEECKGLEHVAAWDRHHVIDRIMGERKWNIS